MGGNVESRLRSMAYYSEPYDHPRANRRYENFALKMEGADVVWLGLVEPPPRPRKAK
jgi:hypothetical protein